MRAVAARHRLEPHIRYGHELARRRVRRRTVSCGRSAPARVRSPRGSWSPRSGALADPSVPAAGGLERFGGHDVSLGPMGPRHDLSGRRVAVIGTGASAIQFVPEIVDRVDRLTLFQRTPPWVLPRANPPIPPALAPGVPPAPAAAAGRLARRCSPCLSRSTSASGTRRWVASRSGRRWRNIERQRRRPGAARQADARLRARLQARARLGHLVSVAVPAQRRGRHRRDRVRDRGWDRRRGRRSPRGRHDHLRHRVPRHRPADRRAYPRPGRRHRWPTAGTGSMQAHLGMAIHGFPNLVMLLGPNTGLGHNSVLLMIEAQLGYLRRLLRYRAPTAWRRSSRRPEAQAQFVADVDSAPQGSVWTAGGCVSWYLDATGRNSTLWPDSVRAYRRRLARFSGDRLAGELSRVTAPSRRRPPRRWRPRRRPGRRQAVDSMAWGDPGRSRRPHGVRLRRRLRDRPRGRGPARRARLSGGDRRSGRAGAEQTAELIDGPVLSRRLDVRDRQAQLAFAAEVADWAPAPLGMVFNNAGVATSQTIAEAAIEDDEWVHQINYGGVVNGTHAFLPILLAPGLRGDRQHLQRVRPGGDSRSERLLRVEVRRPRLHRLAAPGAARAPACGPSACTPAGSRPTSRVTLVTTPIRLARG